MPSSPKIPKQTILQTAFNLLIRDGYDALNIKSISQELNCSTQPVSWHFGNMEGLRRELADYALNYANNKMCPSSENGLEAFSEVGLAYINIAINEPNLFRFLFMEKSGGYCIGGFEALTMAQENNDLIKSISSAVGISHENAAAYLENMIIYTHGILTLVVSGVIISDKEQIIEMIDNAGYAFLGQSGASFLNIKAFEQHKRRVK